MDKKTGKQLLKKGKNFKKWSEGIFVNPFYWVVNETPYYLIGYTKGKKNESVASAFFTLGEEVKEDALAAHPPLALFSDLSANIFNFGSVRAAVSPLYYTKPLSIPVNTTNPEVNTGLNAFANLSKLQVEFNDMFRKYMDYYDNDVLIRGQITEEDIKKTEAIVVQMNLIQNEVGATIVNQNQDIEGYVKYLKEQPGWQSLDRDTKTFLQEITKNRSKIRKDVADLNIIPDPDPKEMFRINYDKMIQMNKRAMESQKKNIRYPK